MLGVVVWADPMDSKAIVWCEDHGDLAYIAMSHHAAADASQFGEGDLIQFDLTEHENLRVAQNPRKIAQHYCSDIHDVVRTAQSIGQGAQHVEKAPESKAASSETVVDLAQWRAARCVPNVKACQG